jgi:phosphate-selective porin OprO/OprP
MVSRGTLFSFASGGGGLANLYRGQVADTAANSGGVTVATTCTAVPTVGGAAGTSSCAATSTVTTTTFGYHVASPNAANAHADNVGIEGILAYNNFKLQGEYSQAFYKASSSSGDSIQADVDTWYAEALWLITGEKYSDDYKKGAFGSLKPKSEFNMDKGTGYGLWELGFRVDAFDVGNTSLTSVLGSRFQGTVDTRAAGAGTKPDTCTTVSGTSTNSTTGAGCGGGAQSYTGSIKWVMNPNMLIKANYTYTKYDNAFAPIDIGSASRTQTNVNTIDHENLLMIRGQYMF